jgi:AcrR family transcriptional regulator
LVPSTLLRRLRTGLLAVLATVEYGGGYKNEPTLMTRTTRRPPPAVPAAIRAAAEKPPHGQGLPFAQTLLARQKADGAKRKGERTRDRLKIAAVQVLEERGYLRLRVTDICKRARVSPAAFYLYFKNKKVITVEVLTEFLGSVFVLGRASDTHRPLFDAIYESNLKWVASVRANPGLMRCLLQLSDDEPAFKELAERQNHEWFLYVTHSLQRRYPKAKLDENATLLAVYALGGMMDELSRKVLVSREEHLQPLVAAIAPSNEALAEFLSVMWYRTLFASDPPRLRHAASRQLVGMSRVDPNAAE